MAKVQLITALCSEFNNSFPGSLEIQVEKSRFQGCWDGRVSLERQVTLLRRQVWGVRKDGQSPSRKRQWKWPGLTPLTLEERRGEEARDARMCPSSQGSPGRTRVQREPAPPGERRSCGLHCGKWGRSGARRGKVLLRCQGARRAALCVQTRSRLPLPVRQDEVIPTQLWLA